MSREPTIIGRLCMIVSLSATAALATAGAFVPNGDEPSKVAREMSSWPLHVVLGVVSIGSVWLSMAYTAKASRLSLERDRMNAATVEKIADSMLSLRDVEMERTIAMNNLTHAIAGKPCLCDVVNDDRRRSGHDRRQHGKTQIIETPHKP